MSSMTASSASADERHRLGEVPLVGVEVGVQQQAAHADDTVHRRADLVAHVGQKLTLEPRCLQRLVTGAGQLGCGGHTLEMSCTKALKPSPSSCAQRPPSTGISWPSRCTRPSHNACRRQLSRGQRDSRPCRLDMPAAASGITVSARSRPMTPPRPIRTVPRLRAPGRDRTGGVEREKRLIRRLEDPRQLAVATLDLELRLLPAAVRAGDEAGAGQQHQHEQSRDAENRVAQPAQPSKGDVLGHSGDDGPAGAGNRCVRRQLAGTVSTTREQRRVSRKSGATRSRVSNPRIAGHRDESGCAGRGQRRSDPVGHRQRDPLCGRDALGERPDGLQAVVGAEYPDGWPPGPLM